MKRINYLLLIVLIASAGQRLFGVTPDDDDAEFERATLTGAVNETLPASLSVRARFDAAYSGGEPTIQGFSIPHFFLGVEGIASPAMSYRLAIGPSREYSSTLIPQILPTEAFFKITSIPQAELRQKASFGMALGMFSPAFNPWWTPDLGELWIPDFFVGQRLLLLSRDIGVEFSAIPIPDRLEISAGFFNGNGVFGFNTNNSRAVNTYTRYSIPAGNWRFAIGGGGFLFMQGTPGSTNYRSHWMATPFVTAEYEPLSLSAEVEGWWGGFDDYSQRRKPRGYSGSLRLGHPRLQGFVRYLNLISTPTTGGYLRELHTGIVGHPLPHFDLFLYHLLLRGRSVGMESSLNLRARFSL